MQMPSTRPSAVRVARSLAEVDARDWNALAGPSDPFLEYEFLRALELSGAVGEGTSWEPRYVLAHDPRGALAGAVPLFVKWDSYGEFIFDWGWAEAYRRAGIDYFPKGVVGAPFTPVSGPRILGDPAVHPLLIQSVLEIARNENLSSVHFLFLPSEQCDVLAPHGFLPRLTHQFHWYNRDYTSFADFLGALRSSKRKQIGKERRGVAESGLVVETIEGDAITAEHADVFWRFYIGTIQRKFSDAYLNRVTFERLFADFRHRLVLIMARDGRRWVGGALHVLKGAGLYGRYWGCNRMVPGLHFECCYYRAIELAIERKLQVVEAGAQGEHKFLRGFEARPIYSAHWIAHPSGRAAIANFLDAERDSTRDLIERYNGISPVKAVRREGCTD